MSCVNTGLGPNAETRHRKVRPAGFEPATYGFEGRRSIQLSYGRKGAPSLASYEAGGVMGWTRGIEPPTSGTTIRRSNQLSYAHHTYQDTAAQTVSEPQKK